MCAFQKIKHPLKLTLGFLSTEKNRLITGAITYIKTGNNFVATGFWNPSKEDLFRIRKEMELDGEEFREIVAQPSFKKVWGTLEEEEVKTAPKGFSKEDPNIDLIRKKAYLFTQKYSDKEVLSPNFMTQVNSDFIAVRPYFDYMSSVLTTDLNGESLL